MLNGSQRVRRTNPRSASRRKIARQQRHNEKNNSTCRKRERIRWARSKQLAPQQLR